MKKKFLDIVAEEKGEQYKTIYEAVRELPPNETLELLESVEDLDDAALVLLDLRGYLKANLEYVGMILNRMTEYRAATCDMDADKKPANYEEFWRSWVFKRTVEIGDLWEVVNNLIESKESK